MATTVPLNIAAGSGLSDLEHALCGAPSAGSSPPAMRPVVPRTGGLFTASDIDSIMDSFGQAVGDKNAESSTLNLTMSFGRDVVGQSFQDVADDFYKDLGLGAPSQASDVAPVKHTSEAQPDAKKIR